MGSYTVVITAGPSHPGEKDSVRPRLTLQIDGSPSDPRVTAIAITTSDPAGLTSQNVSYVDMNAIVTALVAKFPPQVAQGTPSPSTAADNTRRSAHRPPTQSLRPAPVTALSQQKPTMQLEITPELVPEETGPSGRAYRKMPDADELRSSYQRLGTVTAVAKHYGVPRHTAQGWIGRLRKLDHPADQGTPDST